jgi:hypothetical protein
MLDQKMLLNLLLLVLTSVAAVGGSVNVMENYEEHEFHPDDLPEEEKEEFYQYVKQKENFQNMNNASMNNSAMNNASMNNASNVSESFQAQVANDAMNNSAMNNVSNVSESFQANDMTSMNNTSMNNTPTLEGFTGGSFATF